MLTKMLLFRQYCYYVFLQRITHGKKGEKEKKTLSINSVRVELTFNAFDNEDTPDEPMLFHKTEKEYLWFFLCSILVQVQSCY